MVYVSEYYRVLAQLELPLLLSLNHQRYSYLRMMLLNSTPPPWVRSATIGLAYRYRWIEKASAGSSKLLPTLLILFLRQCHSSPVDSDHECRR